MSEELIKEDSDRIFLGQLPIMLRSQYCTLNSHYKKGDALVDLGECAYDQGGYFIINGKEKVIVAQERLRNNNVYIFFRKGIFVAEVRSQLEKTNNMLSSFFIKLEILKKGNSSGIPVIRATIPLINQDIPIIILFRALGDVSDKVILERICYNLEDSEITELLKGSLEEAEFITNQELALDYIGRRGKAIGNPKSERIIYAKNILQNELLSHIGVNDWCETQKAYYIGYIINRLLKTYIGRSKPDDRDHYSNKRIDLSGALMAGLFQKLFHRFYTN
ncbi:DNA-dependent RNA polymerase II [Bonamia ostreae]|uniref:DNA-directed RNA polymerase n=1 Tax=Bonamia ostreae TaxID=126728 RepID=A0ABV2APH5_9EUKA